MAGSLLKPALACVAEVVDQNISCLSIISYFYFPLKFYIYISLMLVSNFLFFTLCLALLFLEILPKCFRFSPVLHSTRAYHRTEQLYLKRKTVACAVIEGRSSTFPTCLPLSMCR
ncbi:hypothetical protein SAY87_031294 [Trapa incisa]|uniref:Uncharacterized protein n=1 Tax=Trapa incisa TaxID=236973 RepID=A0AAN7QKP9_9MYRT|nr:hypothetical protein SAY87_031294 [Trapa incisa]